MLTHSTTPYTGTVNMFCLKVSWFILVLYSCITLAYSSGGDIDIIYLNDGRVIKGKIISGGTPDEYYVQILSKGEYHNIYMRDVKLIKQEQKHEEEKNNNSQGIEKENFQTDAHQKTSSKIKLLSGDQESDKKKEPTKPSLLNQSQRKIQEKNKDKMGVIFGGSLGFPGKYNLDTKIRLGEWNFGYSMGGFESLSAYEFTVGKNFGKITTNILIGSQDFSGNKYRIYDYMGGSIYYKINSLMGIDIGLISGNEDVHEGLQLYLKSGINYEF